jgi:hypothetical protein
MSAQDTKMTANPLLNCPECGLPAEIVDRFTLEGRPTPIEHIKLVCIDGHWFTPPVDSIPPGTLAPSRQDRPIRSSDARIRRAASSRPRHPLQQIRSGDELEAAESVSAEDARNGR